MTVHSRARTGRESEPRMCLQMPSSRLATAPRRSDACCRAHTLPEPSLTDITGCQMLTLHMRLHTIRNDAAHSARPLIEASHHLYKFQYGRQPTLAMWIVLLSSPNRTHGRVVALTRLTEGTPADPTPDRQQRLMRQHARPVDLIPAASYSNSNAAFS